MTQIVPSRFQRRTWTKVKGAKIRTSTFLQQLDVPFREGEDFWKDNAHQLRELYEAMKDAARERMMDLHPDRNGDGPEFAKFIAAYRAAQKKFAFHLVGAALPSTVKFTSKEQLRRDRRAAQARARRRKNRKAFRAYRRKNWAERKANGWRDTTATERAKRWRKRHPIKSKRARKRYIAKNRDKVLAWKRASYRRRKLANMIQAKGAAKCDAQATI